MLHAIHPHATQRELRPDPLAPFQDILLDILPRVVQIRKHEKVIIPMFVADVRSPAFVRTDDLIDCACFPRLVPVNAGEMPPMILHGAVYVATAGELVANPAFDLLRARDLDIPLCLY